jgi:hypothetical protein
MTKKADGKIVKKLNRCNVTTEEIALLPNISLKCPLDELKPDSATANCGLEKDRLWEII